jgi:hypothetical protein
LFNQPSSALSLSLVRPGIQLSEEVLVSGRLFAVSAVQAEDASRSEALREKQRPSGVAKKNA